MTYCIHYCYSGKYIKDGDNKSTDGEENKNGEDTADAGDDDDVVVKSKYEVASEHTASKTDDGDTVKPDKANEADVIKEKIKGAVVYKKGSTNQYFWEVWRRYSEFDLLRNFLQTVYPHVSLCVIALLEYLCMCLALHNNEAQVCMR